MGDRYRLDSVLGRGGVATVWRGWDLRLERAVAVKVLDRTGLGGDPSAATRFDREARTLARLAHPNIVTVYDFGAQDGVAYLVMELVEGRSLAALLAEGALPVAQAAAIAAQVCDALGAAHRAGIIHRDVKPANILIPAGGGVKVCDFGIARLQHAAGQATLTAVDTAIGTSDYMAPEQAAGDPVDARTDLYALGCVLYAMLTGSPPFTGDGPISVVYQHLHRAPVPVRSHRGDVPPDLDNLVGQLLAKSPTDRPADAAQVRTRLTGWAAQPQAARGDAPTVSLAEAGPAGTTRAATAVATPTRTLPAAVPVEQQRPPTLPGRRRRLTSGGLAALAAAVLILLIAALLAFTQLTHTPSRQQAAPPASTPATTGPAPTTAPPSSIAPTDTRAPADQVSALQATIQQLTQAGQLDPHAGNDLSRQLNDLTRGKAHDTPSKIAALQTKLTQLRTDNKITTAGYSTLTASLNQLAASLAQPTTGND
jgi:serine/threonine-protein kinase